MLEMARVGFSMTGLGLIWFGLFPCLKNIAGAILAGKTVGEKTYREKT